VSIEDHRRRLNGSAESTGQLSVAELIARREAETMPIPVITDDFTPDAFDEPDEQDEPTIKFTAVKTPGGKQKKQPMKELHITELLRREGRTDDTQRGGFTVGKLAVAASGGVVLCGSVAFAASSWLSPTDERPLAEVRFDERAQARGASAGTDGVVKLPSNKSQQSDDAETQSADPTTESTTRVAPYVQQQQQRPTQQTQTQQQTTQQPTSEAPTASTPSSQPETTPSQPSTPPSSQTPPPPSSSSGTPPKSQTPPPSSQTPLPTPSNPVDVSVDLGVLDPVLNTVGDVVGGFDFFAPAN
jgi:chemotaxis protein histidine kinase CheA